jgi:formamidopyrimidine-DNA glycosylase
MPELPEVETIVRDLSRLVGGAMIRSARVERPDLIAGEAAAAFERGMEDAPIREVRRRAKNIVLDLGRQLLVVNLGMTGRMLVLQPADPSPAHVGVEFYLHDGRRIVYQDVRRFGQLQRFSPEAWTARDARWGIEPLSEAFSPDRLLELARRSRSPIKSWLMDQQRVVGVGNIYASEALFRAAIDPRRPASTLDPEEARRLWQAVRDVLLEAINFRGTTLLDYRDASGESGGFAERLRVYDRAGAPCRNCGAPVLRIVQGGRSTFFCATCQR